jgi:hypothetical protein
MNEYRGQWILPLSREIAGSLFSDLETTLRLAPQWNVKELIFSGPMEPSAEFQCTVEYDRSEEILSYQGRVESLTPGKAVHLSFRSEVHFIDLSVQMVEHSLGKQLVFTIEADPPAAREDLFEYDLWARSFVNYLKISETNTLRSRALKLFYDRWWLRMSQSGKRLVFFLLIADGFSVVFLVAILLVWKLFS